ncbi:MAG: KUP/HAK/KT family potassium transporter [Bacteroidales bacterium]|nr:KUP/HAK/KT family potassium transporter [Bacteroidales bacterium]
MNKENSSRYNAFNLLGVIVTLGIVYGDIGTSPLYVMKAILGANTGIDQNYIIGAISCIIWTLTLQTTVKYVLITLRADNKGEGGILALYALIRKNKKKWLYVIAIIGASTLIADGIITPSITVVSAIEGLKAIQPDTPVVPISITIITVLFFIQQFGTHAIGRSFGPIMLIWFTTLGILGFTQIIEFPSILKAFNPYYAIKLLIDYPNWFLILGAVFLCTTGAEALYSDLGHCGIKNIRVSWAYVKTTLLLNYLGQGAWVINHLNTLDGSVNPFFAIMPQKFLLPGIILATMAAVIASQALISGSYSIFSEAMSLNFWPRQLIKYPAKLKGQMYIPFVNSFLFVCCVLVILLFQSSSNMEGAYGLSITITMLMTTILLSVYLKTKHVKMVFIVPMVTVFSIIEFSFLVANMFKFLHGGWVTILIASCLVFIMVVWYNARKIKNKYSLFLKIRPYFSIISDLKEDKTVPKYATNLVYLTKANYRTDIESKIIYSIINKQPKRADYYWLLHVDHVDEPNTFEYTFEKLIPNTLFRVDLRIGFKVQPFISMYFRQIIDELASSKEFDLLSNYPSLRKYNIDGDFRFIVIHRVYNQDQGFGFWERFSMNFYNVFRKLGISETGAYGLDTSNVLVEAVPLIVNTDSKMRIKRAK